MDIILDFWEANSAAIVGFIAVATPTVVAFILNKLFNSTSNNLLGMATGVVSKMFGGDTNISVINEKISELPFVSELRDYAKNINIDWEIKLVELKRKLVSPKLSENERIAFEYEYKLIIEQIGLNNVSEGTLGILETLEKNKEV